MAKLIVAGSTGLDTIKTPFGERADVLGGSGIYASFAASFFSPVGLISIAGEDFSQEHINLLTERKIDLTGLQRKGKTFRWGGSYEFDMNEAHTEFTELNSLAELDPTVPEEYKNADYVYLGNLDPEAQIKILDQLANPKFIVMDSMNFWISSKKEELLKLIPRVHLLVLNDGEARQLFDTVSLVKAGQQALELGVQACIIKKGEHGALLFTDGLHFNAPGYPLEEVKDPTGCGDSFGGGLIGYLASTDDISEPNLRKAIVYGSTIASFVAEGFSLERVKEASLDDLKERYSHFQKIREF